MRLFLTLLVLLLPFYVLAQSPLQYPIAQDSLIQRHTLSMDTLQAHRDSLAAKAQHRLDSIHQQLSLVQQQLDSLQEKGDVGVGRMQDSLQHLLSKGQAFEQMILEQQQALPLPLADAPGLQQQLDLPQLGLSNKEVPGVDVLQGGAMDLDLPNSSLSELTLPSAKMPVTGLSKDVLSKDLPESQLPDISQEKLLQEQLSLGQLPQEVPAKIDSSTFSGENLDKRLEEQLLKQKEVVALQEQSGLAEDPLKDYLQQDAKDLAQQQAGELPLKGLPTDGVLQGDLTADQVQKKAVDHFAGKAEALAKARGDLNKHKGRFKEIKSVKELPKNPLKRHPLMGVEWYKRVVPGLQWQLGKEDAIRIDIGPRLSYLVTDKLELGASAQARTTIGKSVPSFVSLNHDRVWGYSLFGNYEVKKGFFGQISYERLNTQAILLPGQQERLRERLWVEGLRMGVGKRYTLYKRLRGYSLIEYNFSPSIHTPYRQQLQVKMGVILKRSIK
ncbi:hypothetical protein [Cesiribacter sp. SM1]|uniref:hypothetical protein n=1 Tax=Cesiribacter sp. SM1 TaxID=2861196 RepID=UPI001CD2BB82|nr:hypothetical protein [Cesiribacter sp. SM1]